MTAGRELEDGRQFRVWLPLGPPGTVFVGARAIDKLGDRLRPSLVARALNDVVELSGSVHIYRCLQRDAGVELAPDGTIDEG